MATEGAGGEQPPPEHSTDTKCGFNMDNLSKPELLTLLSIMEGELEARDLVIEALRARRKEVFVQERYGNFSLTDPFLALQRDCQSGGPERGGERQTICASPVSVLEAVTAHCRKMQERMAAQLAAAETRQKKLEQEKLRLQSLEQEHLKLSAQLKNEREKNKHVVMMLVRECKQLAARVVEEGQRFDDLSARMEEEAKASGHLQEELVAEQKKGLQMEAKMEKQLSELDTEREQLRARIGREEMRASQLRAESDELRRRVEELLTSRDSALIAETTTLQSKATASVAVGTEAVSCKAAFCQTDPVLPPPSKAPPLTAPVKPTTANYALMSLPKSQSAQRGLAQGSIENGPPISETPPTHGFGVSPRVQAVRYKFQSEQEQNGTPSPSPPPRDMSPSSRDSLAAKQQARQTVTQVLSRFTSPPVATTAAAPRPSLPHSASEGGPFPGRISHPPIGLKAPSVGRIDRGTPPPIPPKKPGLSQTPSPPHPPVKVTSKTTTPQLPPKPALDLAVPALATSQVGGRPAGTPGPHPPVGSSPVNPICASPCRPCDTDSPLATASGWRSSIVPTIAGGGPVPLADGRTLLLQAATQGNVTLLSMLLNQDPTDVIPHDEDGRSALYSAAQNGHSECVKLLLSSGISPDLPDKNGFTPLHIAAAHGHSRCVEALAPHVDVNRAAAGGQTPLFLACVHGSPECVRSLLDAGSDRQLVTSDGWTALHAAVSSGCVAVLELLIHHPPGTALPTTLLNYADRDGWTASHIAASKGFKDCLEVLCAHGEQDIEKQDKCNRTIHDVATDDCKDLLENLYSYRVLVRIQRGSVEQICTLDMLDERPVAGTLTVHKHTSWPELCQSLACTLTAHFHLLCGGWEKMGAELGADTPLGLHISSISSVLIGEAVWFPGQELPQSPWDLIRKPHGQQLTVRLKGLGESCLDEMAYESLIPLQLLQNYSRLVEQYHNVIFHGLEGGCQEYIANLVSLCIKHKQESMGLSCDIIRVEIDQSLCKEHLLETFINCGFLVPFKESGAVRSVLILLEGLERASSLPELLGDLCEGLENRGMAFPMPQLHAQDSSNLFHFHEGSFLIGSLSKPCLHGPELLLQQHFRWVQLRWDSEPLVGLLARHLHRKLVHKMRGQTLTTPQILSRSVTWICSVWFQLNTCLARLGTPEALLGPQMFLSCPLVPEQPQAVIRWLSRLWNMAVVPRVEEAIVSRVMGSRSPMTRRTPHSKSLNSGQQAVVKAVLSILVNKAVLQGCPLPRTDVDQYLTEFQSGNFPLLSHGSLKLRGQRSQDRGAWRKASTSPRKKGGLVSGWSSSSGTSSATHGAGLLSGTELHGSNNRPQKSVEAGAALLSLCCDEEADLMQELQTICSSKSEPDISKITHFREDFLELHGTPWEQRCQKVNVEEAHQPHTQASGLVSRSTRTEKQSTRPKSQLPVPSSKGVQRARSTPGSSPNRTPSSSSSSNRARQTQSNNQPLREDIWILHKDGHQTTTANNNNKKKK